MAKTATAKKQRSPKKSPKKSPKTPAATPSRAADTSATIEYAWIAEPLRGLAEPIEKLSLDPLNARTHDADNLASIAASLEKFGQLQPLVVNRQNGRIVAGNGRYLAATKRLGWTHLAVVWVDQDESAQRGYSIADNRTAELAGWDDALLETQLALIEEDSPELYDALFLDGLRVEEEEQEQEDAGGAQTVPESWQIVVDCEGEEDQRKFFKQLEKQGRKCRLLTM